MFSVFGSVIVHDICSFGSIKRVHRTFIQISAVSIYFGLVSGCYLSFYPHLSFFFVFAINVVFTILREVLEFQMYESNLLVT